jgi:hypothetical protein
LLADLTTCKALRELPEEEGPAAGQRVQDRLVGRGLLDRGGGSQGQRRRVSRMKRDPAVAGRDGSGARPENLAGSQ